MGKCLVGFCHSVCVFFLLKCSAFALTSGKNFARQLIGHAFTISFPAVADQPLDTQRNFAVGTNFCRNLKSSTPDTAASYFHCRSDVIQSPSPDFISVIIALFGNAVDGIVEQSESGILFTLPHQVVYKTRNQDVIVFCIRSEW